MGGGNCLFGTEVTPIFRGNHAVVEIASETSNPTKLPDTEPLRSGKLETVTRYFDLFCVGKCAGTGDLKLNIQSASKIPELITKNAAGEPVFAEPTSMCTIKGLAGHNVWVNIELDTITTKASDYIALGIRKRGEEDYYDVLYNVDGHKSRYVDVLETDVVELIPLASSTPLSTKYTAVKAGDTAKITGADSYDFGSVYRVQVKLHDSQWVDQSCDLNEVDGGGRWDNDGGIGVGSVVNDAGKVQDNQLLAITAKGGKLARSSDGIHWFDVGSLPDGDGGEWWVGPAYGNNTWCVTNCFTGVVKRSIDYGKSWVTSSSAQISTDALRFYNGLFMIIATDGKVYTSLDAECWRQIGSTVSACILGYNNSKWMCGDGAGHIYCSKDNGATWEYLSDNLCGMGNGKEDCRGGVYVNGYFYAVRRDGLLVRSTDGINWETVLDFKSQYYYNVTFYKNKLYLFERGGTISHVCLFRPDGTM